MDLSIISKNILIACDIISGVQLTRHFYQFTEEMNGKMAVLLVDLVIHIAICFIFGGYYSKVWSSLSTTM